MLIGIITSVTDQTGSSHLMNLVTPTVLVTS